MYLSNDVGYILSKIHSLLHKVDDVAMAPKLTSLMTEMTLSVSVEIQRLGLVKIATLVERWSKRSRLEKLMKG